MQLLLTVISLLLFLEQQHEADLFISHDIHVSLCGTLPPLSPTHPLEGTLHSLKHLISSLHEKKKWTTEAKHMLGILHEDIS